MSVSHQSQQCGHKLNSLCDTSRISLNLKKEEELITAEELI